MAFKTGSATNYIDALDKLVAFALAEEVTAVAGIAAGGLNYSLNDVLSAVGGTPETTATFTVSSIDIGTGEVTGISVTNAGLYTGTPPGDPVSTTYGGAGTGCTLNLTWAGALGWTQQRNTVYSGSDKEVILLGDGGGAYNIYVGVRTFNNGSVYNWELAGFTGYAGGSLWGAQPGISPGRYDGPDVGAYVPLRNAAITYWYHVTNRRIIAVFKVGTVYTNMYLGLVNPYGTITEYPYPLAVFGCCSVYNTLYSTSTQGISGLTDPIDIGGTSDGVAYLRDPGGTWLNVLNSKISGTSRAELKLINVFPVGRLDYAIFPAADKCVANVIDFRLYAPIGAAGTAPTYKLYQTPATSLVILIPNFIAQGTPLAVLGELDNVFWVSSCASPSNIISEDTVTIGGDVYTCFQQGQRTDFYSYFAIKRE